MTPENFIKFEKALINAGYRRYDIKESIQREDFYYAKSVYNEDSDDIILFLIYDNQKHHTPKRHIPRESLFGVTPYLITESDEWPRIGLSLTGPVTPDSIPSLERLAEDFSNFIRHRPFPYNVATPL